MGEGSAAGVLKISGTVWGGAISESNCFRYYKGLGTFAKLATAYMCCMVHLLRGVNSYTPTHRAGDKNRAGQAPF
jgi:hypothetical protein